VRVVNCESFILLGGLVDRSSFANKTWEPQSLIILGVPPTLVAFIHNIMLFVFFRFVNEFMSRSGTQSVATGSEVKRNKSKGAPMPPTLLFEHSSLHSLLINSTIFLPLPLINNHGNIKEEKPSRGGC
jgi:hypothetical protein